MASEGLSDVDFIRRLKTLDGAIPYDGDASVQVVFKLANGKTLRIGVTDDDVADRPGLWCDQYPGLLIVGGDPLLSPKTCGCKCCDGSCMHD